uniref:Cyclin Y like 1 n=1 Tax=Aotus nancymaae TaxID=37293 RepID=A0A2K5CAY8_AOTNA
MGNTLTCCVSPNASPKLGRRAGSAELYCASDIYEAASGDAVAVAPAAVEPAELDFGEGEGHHLQHISDREMPEEKESHYVDQAGFKLLAWAQAALPPQPPE